MATAERQTGLSDWGETNFLEALRVLLDACQKEAGLSLTGQHWLQQECIHSLANRLRIQDTLKNDPAILEVPVRRPLFIATLPRSGSTFLHRLLAQDTQARVLLHWELQQPAPPPRIATYTTDPRITQAVAAAYKEQSLFSGSKAMHTVKATIPEECCYLLKNSCTSFDTTFWYHIPTYYQWLCEHDLTDTYQYYKKQLQILSYHYPGEPFFLKEPSHLLGLDAILNVFPDACFVQVHRSPYQQVASLCSLQGNTQNALRHTPIQPHDIGQIVL
ncbi:MAG: sulfotransferase, partial [Pseudomonadota bacterium]